VAQFVISAGPLLFPESEQSGKAWNIGRNANVSLPPSHPFSQNTAFAWCNFGHMLLGAGPQRLAQARAVFSRASVKVAWHPVHRR